MTEQNNRFKNSKIYVIRCRSDISLIYVGSTTQELCKRFYEHKHNCYNVNQKAYHHPVYCIIRANQGIYNFYIELYENYSCNNKDELKRKEGEVIRLIGTMNFVKNTVVDDKIEYQRTYQKDYSKLYHTLYKAEIQEQQRIYYQANQEQIKLNQKEYRVQNKLAIREKQNMKNRFKSNKKKLEKQMALIYKHRKLRLTKLNN